MFVQSCFLFQTEKHANYVNLKYDEKKNRRKNSVKFDAVIVNSCTGPNGVWRKKPTRDRIQIQKTN